ncbi:MAG: ABC transporter substrate-binding protein [Actinomycetota bacterium]|jgi:ABC-type nitrate/sulfonate/bicarbonate transport system substrate-binding protein|nr:ABC transporter substrate-binding protein [Actinomycetota bacterium]
MRVRARRFGRARVALAGASAVVMGVVGGVSLGTGGASAAAHKALPPIANIDIGLALSPPKVVFMGPYVAQAEGFFRKERLNVHFISMPNGLQTELGTTAGTINFGFSSATDAIESAAANAPIHAIASYGLTLDTECVAAPGIHSAKQLIGQPVGSTGAGGFSIVTLAACLSPEHVSISQVKPITMTRSEFVPALTTGRIKVAVFHADDAYVVLHQLKGATVLYNEYQSLPKWWYGGITALDSYTKHHVAVTERFLAALIMANRWMNNPKNTAKLIDIGVSATQEDRAAVAYAVHFEQQSKTWPTGLGLPPASVEYTAHRLVQLKVLKTAPSYYSVVNPTYQEAALKMVGNG